MRQKIFLLILGLNLAAFAAAQWGEFGHSFFPPPVENLDLGFPSNLPVQHGPAFPIPQTPVLPPQTFGIGHQGGFFFDKHYKRKCHRDSDCSNRCDHCNRRGDCVPDPDRPHCSAVRERCQKDRDCRDRCHKCNRKGYCKPDQHRPGCDSHERHDEYCRQDRDCRDPCDHCERGHCERDPHSRYPNCRRGSGGTVSRGGHCHRDQDCRDHCDHCEHGTCRRDPHARNCGGGGGGHRERCNYDHDCRDRCDRCGPNHFCVHDTLKRGCRDHSSEEHHGDRCHHDSDCRDPCDHCDHGRCERDRHSRKPGCGGGGGGGHRRCYPGCRRCEFCNRHAQCVYDRSIPGCGHGGGKRPWWERLITSIGKK